VIIVPLQPAPAQTVGVTLNGQSCRIVVKQRRTGVFLDLYVNDAPLACGVLCLVGNRLVRSRHIGFAGDLAFIDTQADRVTDLVSFEGIGSRFFLAYYP
jgi:hypothetical protein